MNRKGFRDTRLDDLAAYALDALDEDEQKSVQDLLARSEEARRELATLQETVAVLADAVPPAEPPADLRRRILAATYAPARRPIEFTRDDAVAAGPDPVIPAALGRSSSRSGRIGTVASLVALAAAVALVVTFGLRTMSLQKDIDGLSGELSAERAAVSSMKSEIAALSEQIALNSESFTDQELQVSRLAQANSALQQAIRDQRWVTYVTFNRNWETPSWFREGTEAPHAQGQIVMSPTGDRVVMFVDGLPTLEEGWQYKLWLAGDGWRWDAASFNVDDTGYARVDVSGIPDGVRYFTTAVITRAAQSTSDIDVQVLAAPVSR